MHLIYKQLRLYISLYIKKRRFSIVQWRFIFHLYFLNQTEFDLKSINQEFLLFLKLLNKTFYSIFQNRIMNYELKSVLFVDLGFDI